MCTASKRMATAVVGIASAAILLYEIIIKADGDYSDPVQSKGLMD